MKTSKPLYKPLIASSLALALGVSVAVATDPTISINGTSDQSPSNLTWKQESDNYVSFSLTDNSSRVVNDVQIEISSSGNTTLLRDRQQNGGFDRVDLDFASTTQATLNGNSKGLKIGANGTGTLIASLWNSDASQSKTITLDLSNPSSTYALLGNLYIKKTGGVGTAEFNGTFGGQGIKGNVTFETVNGTGGVGLGTANVTLKENAGIDGSVLVKSNGTYSLTFQKASGGSVTGSMSFSDGSANTTIKNLTSVTNGINLQSGSHTINFQDSNGTTASVPTLTANINLSGGTTTINGLANLTGNITASGSATLNLSNTAINGDITFNRYNQNVFHFSENVSISGVGSVNAITTKGDWGYQITKKMQIVFGSNASGGSVGINGKILSQTHAFTELVFSQNTSITLGNGNAIDIEASQTGGNLGGVYSKNILVLTGSTTAKIGTISSSGDYGGGVSSGDTLNTLSFNNTSNGNISINKMTATRSYNIIGKDLVTYSSSSTTYDTSLFVDGGYRGKKFNGSVAEFVKSAHSASGTFTFGDNSSGTIGNAIVTDIVGANYINISGTTAIKGNVLSSVSSSPDATSGHNNLIVLTGTSTTLGEDSKAISIKVANNEGSAYNKTSNNTLLLGATTNTLILSALSAKGTYNSEMAKNFNALSINSGTTTATITSVNAGFGTNIIGKDLITQGDSSGYNTTLFGNANTPVIQSGFIAEFVKSTHSASGTFTFGDNSTSPITDAISTSQGGLNYINVSGTTTIKGNILSSTQGSTGGNNNLIVLTGTSATLGEDGKAISIKVNNVGGEAHIRNSNNTLLLGATTNTLTLSDLSALGTYNSDARANFNALSFNSTTDNGNQTLGEISASNGSNIIGKDLITQGDSSGSGSGYNTTLFGNANTPTIQRNNISSTFMSDTHTAKGTYNITSLTIENTVMGGNYINVENLTITDGVKASSTNTTTSNERFVENYIYTNGSGTSSISGGVSVSTGGSVDTKNVITFAGSGTNSISGEISASGGSNNIKATKLDLSSANIIANSGNNTITIDELTSSIQSIQTTDGTNTITIRNSTSDITIANGITSSGSSWNSEGNNIINIEKANANLIISTIGITTQKSSSDWYRTAQKNNITFSNGGILTLTTGNISAQNGNQNNITFNGTGNATITLLEANAKISASDDGKNNFNFAGSQNTIASLMTKDNTGQNNLTLLTDNSTLTLKGQTNAISTLTAVSGEATNKDTLIIDTSTNANATSIDKLVNGGNLIVSMKGATNSATLTLNNTSANSTLKALNLTEATSDMDKNILNLQARTTTILDEVNIEANKGLTINLNGTSTLELDNGLSNSGNAKISFGGSNGVFDSIIDTNGSDATTTINIASDRVGVITGEITQSNGGANNVVFNGGTAKLTLQGSSNALNSVDSTSAGILSLDGAGSQSGVQATITTLTGNNLTANFNGNQTKEAKLILSNGGKTLAGVTLGANSTNNTLSLQNGKTTISGAISVGANQGIAFDLSNGVELALNGGMSGAGDSAVNIASNTTANSATLSGTEAITLNTANLSGDNSSTLTLKAQTIDIATLNANATTSNKLTLDSSSNNVSATLHNIVGNLDVELNSTSNASTLTLNGGRIQSISATNGGADKNLAVFSSGSNVIASAIDNTSVENSKGLTLQVNSGATLHAQGGIDNSSAGTINVALNGGTLTFGTHSNHISQLSGNGGRVDLATTTSSYSSANASQTRNTLTIDNYTSESTTFNLFVSSSKNDQITLSNGGSNAKAILTLKGEMDVYDITYSNHTNANNTLVAKASNNIAVESGISLIGVNDVVMDLVSVVNGTTTDYYIGKVVDLGVDPVFQEIASTALTVNYDLFLANFNSLNKRMGELRESEHSNGVWARVFGGSMSNDFGSGSKTDYVTAQAGYDYSLSIGENARNFMGIALAYGTSNTKGNTLALNTNGASSNSVALDKVNSNMIEVGLYNSYVADSGWYNDTILKFDYIMSEFSFSTDPTRMSETNNFAMVLSDEFGYRYSFGESEKGSWYIDPQVEVAFGYFNQSDFNRAVFNGSNTFADLQARQDSILTLRSRIGASLGKKFTTDKGFASIYVGASYEYDYIEGGNSEANGGGSSVVTQLDKVESNGRAVLNVGSNIELTKGARMYIDVEKSFGDKQRTFMQFNLGARYSF